MGQEGLYYFFNVLTKSLRAAGDDVLTLADGRTITWREEVARKLVELQRPDGSWVNDNNRWWEADPNLVTAYTLLALAAELEVDFSRKLVQEIVRRKQPPTQEEIWREEIDNAWNYRYREGEAKRGVWERMSILEKQFRAAHEAGELSDETYLEFMRKLGVDIKKDPASTPFPYKPPLTAPGKSAD